MSDLKEYLISIPELKIYVEYLRRRARYFREKTKEERRRGK